MHTTPTDVMGHFKGQLTENAAILIAQIINNDLSTKYIESFEANLSWISQCYNKPSAIELELNALDSLLNGYGVETIRSPDVGSELFFDRYYGDVYFRGDIVAEYINTGDTYNPTVVYNRLTDEYLLTTWGDFVENLETKIDKGEI